MKKYLSIFLSIVMVLAVFGSIVYAETDSATTYNILDVKDKIRTVGRTGENSAGIYCDWTASGIEFSANCQGNVALTIQASCTDVGNKGEYNKDCYFTVYIDGVRQNYRVRVMNGTYTVNIAEDLVSGNHTFKVLKQNERSTTQTVIQKIILNGTLNDKPAAPEYVFEFIGDSITSGFGSLDKNNQASRYSDGTRTYAYITAENFGAEARVTSVSGGTINSVFSSYKKDTRSDNLYDFSLTKPNVVVVAFGTNDGAKTVDYWQNGLKDVADTIRGGYNDNNIPIVFIHNLITNNDPLRANVSEAIKNLQKTDAEKYSKIFVTYGCSPDGGHPPQSKHKSTAGKLTRDLIEYGIMPKSALKADATVTINEQENETRLFKSFDTVIAPSKSGITGELVEPLDPNDAGSETAKATKYVADGTQPATTSYRSTQVSLGSLSNSNYSTKGISFYINYKDTTDYSDVENPTKTQPYIIISQGDKMKALPISVEQGVTQKVELYWDTLPLVDYVFSGFISSQNPTISLEMTGKCEYIIDNMQALLNKYTHSVNPDASYTYTQGGVYPLMGITEGYEPESSSSTSGSSSSSDYLEVSDVSEKDNWIAGEYDYQTGQYKEVVARACVKNLIKIDTSKSYKFATNNSNTAYQFIIREYNASGSFIKSIGAWTDVSKNYKPTSGTSYISVSLFDAGGSTTKMLDLITNAIISPSMTVASDVPTVTEPSTDPSEPSSSDPVVPGEAVAKIGETEYSSLFGENGAIAKASSGDRIVMVADEEYEFNPSTAIGQVLAEISENIVLDLAGHTVNVTRSNTNRGELFRNTVPFEIASTVDGLGETNTDKKGVIKGVATIVNVSDDFKASNVELRSSLGDDSYGAAIKSGVAGKTVTLRDVVAYAPKMAIFANGGKINMDCDNSTIYANYYALRLTLGGVFKNSTIYTTNNYTCEISADNLLFDNCNIYVGQYDQFVLKVSSGNVTLANGTVVDGKGKAGNVVHLTGTAKLITDNAKIFNTKNASGKYALNIASTASAELGDTIITSPSNTNPSNVNLYKYLKQGKAIYTSDVPSEETLIPEDYAVADYKNLYIRDAIKSNTVTIDGEEVSYSGEEFTFPVSSAKGFVAYTDGENFYDAGNVVTVDKDLAFTTVSIGQISMLKGASMRLNEKSGLRFYTSVDTEKVADLISSYTNAKVTMGTMIAHKDRLGDNDLTLDLSQKDSNNKQIWANVPFPQSGAFDGNYYTEDLSSGKFTGIVGSIVNIRDTNILQDFVGRGYITVSLGDYTKTVYADYAADDTGIANISNNTRNVGYVAYNYRKDNIVDNKYKEIVDKYADAYQSIIAG